MLTKTTTLLATAAVALIAASGTVSAQPGPGYGPPPPQDNGYGPPPQDNGYGTPPQDNGYGPSPQDNRYGPPPRDDRYGPPDRGGPPGGYDDRGARYDYGSDCRNQNTAGGTVLGAIAGGVIGNQFGHGGGKTAATVGGVILGGVIGNKIAGDMDCQDRQYAFHTYNRGLDGRIGQRYDWRDPRGHYGYFTPTREYRRHHRWCRDFEEGVWRHGRWNINTGTACRFDDGWHFM